MVQESTMICLDNSEWMRNGDFQPTRLQSQQDAANLVIQCKLRSNPENAVGLLSMANEVRVLSSMSTEAARLLMKIHQLEPTGACNLISSIKVAHLALKHRQNRNHKMRIVLFVGSPVDIPDGAELIKLAKKLKKEKVQCDVVVFGDTNDETNEKFTSFIDTLNGKEGTSSNLVIVPSGSALTDAIMSTSICGNEDGGNSGMGGGFEFGVDPDNDPDLALALRVSMEEERARQAAANGGAVEGQQEQPAVQDNLMDVDMGAMTEEQQLEWALRLSMQENVPEPGAAEAADKSDDKMEVDVTGNNTPDNLEEIMNNPELLQQIVDELPGDEKKDDKESK